MLADEIDELFVGQHRKVRGSPMIVTKVQIVTLLPIFGEMMPLTEAPGTALMAPHEQTL
jgi:hypothetical protein